MSPADNADALTPLMRLRRRRRAFRIFGVFLILVLLLLAGMVLAVNQGRNYLRLIDWLGIPDYLEISQPAASEAPQRYRRLSRIAGFPPRMTSPQAQTAGAFKRFPGQAAYERCRQLGADGNAASFQASGDDWECLLSRELGSTPEASALFIQARGASPDSFRTFRAKLSLLDPAEDDSIIRLTLDSIDRFGLALSPESRRYIEHRIASRRNFSSMLENYRIVFERERGDDKRFNLLIVPLSTATACPSPRPDSNGARMRSAIVQERLGCLSLQHSSPASGRSVEPD
jgi:hypothetical protein